MQTFVQAVIDGITAGSLYALFALGVALVFGIMRLINFAHGEVVMIGTLCLLVLGALVSQKYAPETANRGLQEEPAPDAH